MDKDIQTLRILRTHIQRSLEALIRERMMLNEMKHWIPESLLTAIAALTDALAEIEKEMGGK